MNLPHMAETDISRMEERKNDLEYQLALCHLMMQTGDILPFPFERAVILLRKEKCFEKELMLCRYVQDWCKEAEKGWDGRSAMVWKSPKLQKCIERIPKIEALLTNQK